MPNRHARFPSLLLFLVLCLISPAAFASEADIKIPDLSQVVFPGLGG
ncbi:MAG: hypothetical protein HZA89_16055, partial [Verrucomicrobia bacterium]|nr:hypothetical protein [Verrucomicrobiota bacterium]